MKKTIQTTYTDQEFREMFRQIIREEVKTILSNENLQIGSPSATEFINIEQASEFIKIKVSTIYNLVNAKKIPFSKAGRRLLFSRKDLSDWAINDHQKLNRN